jgi:hypothetical protein
MVVLGLTGCAIQLAPSFDRSIVDGLAAANEQTMTLFASVSAGTRKEAYGPREPAYNGAIGKFDALRIQAEARPVPRPILHRVFGVGPSVDAEPAEISTLDQAPSIPAIQEIVNTITRMRDQDRSRGLSPNVVAGYKNAYESSIDQAITYEKALER